MVSLQCELNVDLKVKKTDITASLKEALQKEKMLENFSNSESEKEYQRKKQLQRKHPINCDLIDANDLFDKIKIQRNSSTVKGETTNFDLIVPPELMDGNYAQEACASKVGEIFGKRYPYKNNWLKKPHFPYFNRLKLTEFAFLLLF